MQISANSDIADRLESASFNGMRSIRSPHLREAADEIRKLRSIVSKFVLAFDDGRKPTIEDYDAARNAIPERSHA